jgi:hypothetical protein
MGQSALRAPQPQLKGISIGYRFVLNVKRNRSKSLHFGDMLELVKRVQCHDHSGLAKPRPLKLRPGHHV